MYKKIFTKLGMPEKVYFKIMLIMRLTTVILIASLMQASASSFAQKISLNVTQASLNSVFEKIRIQSGVDFLISKKVLEGAKPVSIKVSNTELKTVLEEIFKDQPLDFEIQEKMVVVRKKDPSFLDKVVDRFLKVDAIGQVLDKDRNPLSGATIKLKGTKRVSITDKGGRFIIRQVEDNDTLIISYTGFQSREVLVKNIPKEGIVLYEFTSNLNEVTINTGYQTISKERSAGSFSKPDMKQFANANSASNLIARLDGLVPGLTINNNVNSPAVLIRGLTSINTSTTPLYVVDGLPVTDISTLNFNDVADITVLKDATAASIWGARAANGVITIVTKKGERNSKLKIDYDVVYTFKGKPDLDYQPRMNSAQFIQAVKEVYGPELIALYPLTTINGTAAPFYPHEQIMYDASLTDAQKDAKLNDLAKINNFDEAKDLWYRNSFYANHSLAVSGGGRVHSFRGAFSYTNNTDATPGNKDNGYNVLLRNDFDFGNRIKAYLITQLNASDISSKNPYNYNPNEVPYVSYLDENGNGRSLSYLNLPDQLRNTYETQSGINLDFNPVDEVNRGSTKSNPLNAKLTGGVTVNLFKGLRFEGVYGYQRNSNKTTTLDDQDSYTVRKQIVQFTKKPVAGGLPTYYLPTTGANFSSLNQDYTNWTIRNQMIYDREWKNGEHQLTVLAGQEAQEQFSNFRKSTLKGYDPKLLNYGIIDYNLLAGTGVAPVWSNTSTGNSKINSTDLPYSESETELRFTSYYANASYSYKRKYVVNGNWRIDHSNSFGKEHSAQNKPVWSAGLAWNISNEAFMSDVSAIDRLTLRGTYGLTGNSPLPGTGASYDIVGPVVNGFYGKGLALTTPGNASLTWETTKTLNFGLDFSVLNNRLSGSIDFYKKNTDNLIGTVPLNVFSGYPSIIGNYGNMTNNGIELSLNSMNITRGQFSWRSGLILAYNKNKITKLLATTPITDGSQLLNLPYVEGYSAYALFAYRYAGLDNLGNPHVKFADGNVSNNDVSERIKPEDMVYAGTYQPIWNGGFSNTFTIKRVSLSANIVYNLGNVMRRTVNDFYSDRIVTNLNPEFANRWKKPGDELTTNIPSYVANYFSTTNVRNTNYYTSGDLNMVSASFVKLRDLNLSYNLTGLVAKKIKVESIVLRAGISNVMLWKKNKFDIDPEFTGQNVYPVNQNQVTIGAHLIF